MSAEPISLRPAEDELLEARIVGARGLIAAGFDVLPLWSTELDGTCRCQKRAACDSKPGKHPIAPAGTWNVTHDPVAAETMLRAGSRPNLGVIPPVGVFAWDVDGEAPALLDRLSAELGPLPATYGHLTRNGRHRFYRWPAEIDRPSGELFGIVTRWPNSDRGRGYVVGPYSRVGEYVYRPEGSPAAIEPLPDAWALAASRSQSKQRPAIGETPTGSRHNNLRDDAYFLHKRGLSGPALRAAIDAINAALPEPKSPADVARAIGDVDRFDADPDVTTAPEPDHLRGMNAAELLDLDIPSMRQALAGLLPEGLGVLGAPPKAGKSLLAYQLAVELVCGGDLFGVEAERRPVRYYALEDGRRRSQGRIRALLRGRAAGLADLDLRWTAPNLGGPLEAEVGAWLDEHPLGVVIVDVLSKVRSSGKAGLNAYDEDYAAITGLHTAARRHPGSVVLLVTHDRKAGSDDWMTRITGTRGVTGAADFVIFIARKRTEMIGTVYVTGRDIEDRAYDVEFTGTGWRLAGIDQVIGRKSPTRQTIFNWLRENGPTWQKAIAEGTGLSETVVYNRVSDMTKDGELIGGPDGYRTSSDE